MDRPWSLLVLPPPPSETTNIEDFTAAYGPALTSTIAKIKTPDRQAGLVVAVSSPAQGHDTLPWVTLHSFLSGVYGLIAVLCGQEHIPCESDGGAGAVDPTVILLDLGKDRRDLAQANPTSSTSHLSPSIPRRRVPVLGLQELAAPPGRSWDCIYYADWHAGPSISEALFRLSNTSDRLAPIVILNNADSSGDSAPYDSARSSARHTPLDRLYNKVCLGGTFDHLHVGHRLLLSAAVLLLDLSRQEPCELLVGITGGKLLHDKKYQEHMQSWDDRAQCVLAFLSTFLDLNPYLDSDLSGKVHGAVATEKGMTAAENPREAMAMFRDGAVVVRCVEIWDPFGPTIKLENIDALVVSRETQAGGRAVNDKRRALGWKELDIFTVNVIDAESLVGTEQVEFATKISSTTIRKERAEATRRL